MATSGAIVPQPPRLTGDPQADAVAIENWMWEFYNATVVETGLLDPSAQSTASTWDPNNLPDPTSTTIANAQQTANLAYKYADLINKAFADLGKALAADKWQQNTLAYQFAVLLNDTLITPLTPPTTLPTDPAETVTPPTP